MSQSTADALNDSNAGSDAAAAGSRDLPRCLGRPFLRCRVRQDARSHRARYLSHLGDDRAEVNQLVAITFTDRAARQMRERIRAAVGQKVQSAKTEEEAERWARHLRDLQTAQVSTIHAFCGTLLRQHAVEAGLDPHFDVLEDVLAVNLEAEALTDCLQTLLTAETETGEDLRQLVLLYGWRPTVEAVQSLIREWDEPEWKRWLDVPAEQIAAHWWDEDRPRVLSGYVAHLVVASPKIAGCLMRLRTTDCIGPLMQANVARLLQETPRLAEAARPGRSHRGIDRSGQGRQGKRQGLAKRGRLSRQSRTPWGTIARSCGIACDLSGDRSRVWRRPSRLAGASCTSRRRRPWSYRQRKRRAGVVDFQDLLVQARDLLRDHPEVREALQRRYRFLLVDELQDTDPVQMELVKSLTGAGLTTGKLFAVGDHKQSIYRFRGAEVALFQQLRQEVPHEGRLELSVNFRSQPAILDFTNALARVSPRRLLAS